MDASPRPSAPAAASAASPSARLSVEQERDLVIATEAGDRDAALALVEAFLPEINGLARRFRHALGVEHRDLVQEGVTALLFAARRYDARLDTPFWGYAAFWVRKAMQELVADLSRAVVLSDRAVRSLAALRAARNDYQLEHGRDPSSTELAQLTGFSRTQVEQLLAADGTPRSLDVRMESDDAGSLADRIPDPHAEQAYDAVLDDIELGEVRTLWESLSERELFVLHAHYGVSQPVKSLAQIGADLGLSAERARQIEAGALGRMRSLLVRAARPKDFA